MENRYKIYYDSVRYLKKTLPLSHSLSVRRVDLPATIDGDCAFRKGKFYIRIDKKLPEYYAIDVLLHEVAHCLAWDQE